MDVPRIQFAHTDDGVRIAYQVFGDGPPLVVVPPAQSAIEGLWHPGRIVDMWERLAANVRVVMFDHRGAGLSDGFEASPTLADRALDVKAVLTAAGMDRASLWGLEFGSQVAVGFAVEFPGLIDRLVLSNSRVGSSAREMADELAPDAPAPSPGLISKGNLGVLDNVGAEVDEVTELYNNPSLAKYPDLVDQMLPYQRMVGSRTAQKRQAESVVDADVVGIAARVEAPTLIIHSIGSRVHHIGYGRYLAQLIPNATLLELPGDDLMYWLSDNWKDYVDAGIEFVSNSSVDAPLDRRFAAVMFTDIVESTTTSVGSGDSEWRDRLDLHDRISERVVVDNGGALVKTTGDGVLATFEMPSHALAAALELNQRLSEASIPIRTGIHAGEIEVRGADISGATVHLAARVEQSSVEGHIYTTKAVSDMLIGSDYEFHDAGCHTLKGFDGEWQLFSVTVG
jgi:class 3 adenylate cyclase/alpha-beta hydrolase superfamily lysophospholipase